MHRWAAEIAATGTFSAPLGSGGPGGLPVPYLVISNKADIAAKEGIRGSSGNLVDAARQWVEKQGLLSSSEELPLTESFPGSSGLITVRTIDNIYTYIHTFIHMYFYVGGCVCMYKFQGLISCLLQLC